VTDLNSFYGFLIGKRLSYAKTMCFSMSIRVLIKDGEHVTVDNTYKDNRLTVETDKDNFIIRIMSIG